MCGLGLRSCWHQKAFKKTYSRVPLHVSSIVKTTFIGWSCKMMTTGRRWKPHDDPISIECYQWMTETPLSGPFKGVWIDCHRFRVRIIGRNILIQLNGMGSIWCPYQVVVLSLSNRFASFIFFSLPSGHKSVCRIIQFRSLDSPLLHPYLLTARRRWTDYYYGNRMFPRKKLVLWSVVD